MRSDLPEAVLVGIESVAATDNALELTVTSSDWDPVVLLYGPKNGRSGDRDDDGV